MNRQYPTTSIRAVSVVLLWAAVATIPARTSGEDVSRPAMLQFFEARWQTIEERLPDIFAAEYGSLWLPPPGRADSGPFSVGYDVFDRFDLGSPRHETLYGTESGLKSLAAATHRASARVFVDFIANHNGFGNRSDPNFVALGGYPGFALTLPDDSNGDFHDPGINFDSDPFNGQLAGLNDIAHEKQLAFIRNPVAAGHPDNIPAGTQYNRPDPGNARFYPDRDSGGLLVYDPEQGREARLYDFDVEAPASGDAVPGTVVDLLKRNARWLIQVMGVDGLRIDAAKHFDEDVLDELDQAVFRANPRRQHDGSFQPAYLFSEVLDGNAGFVNQFTRRDLPNRFAIDPSNTTVAGNRDALDFPLFFALRSQLTGEATNNWHGVRNASLDLSDDGLANGSQGVSFVDSHDDQGGTPFLKNVAYAYTLLRPGEALVYFNAGEFGDNRDFPQDGKVDALGGVYGDTIRKLVEIRNSHGRGDFHERWIDEAFGDTNGDGRQESNVYVYERFNSAVIGLSNRADDTVEDRRGIATGFASGTILVELTGNADDPTVDPADAIPGTVKVSATGHIDLSIPGNGSHGRGYVIYGVARPQGELHLTNVAATLNGDLPAANSNGTARLASIDVIRSDAFEVRLNTEPVSLVDPENGQLVRDPHADGDSALLRIDEGLDLNDVPGIDNRTPGTVAYGFESFTDTRVPGYIDEEGANVGSGEGSYVQSIDATQLAEGRHFLTVRAFRHRDSSEPAVYRDFRKTIYVDRLPPESDVVRFEPFATDPGTTENRDLIVRSLDKTADNMHVFLDLPAAVDDQQVLEMALAGENDAGVYDADEWVYGFFGVTTGNHVATVVTFEPTFDGTHGYNVQRFAGLHAITSRGSGFGDLDANGTIEPVDLLGQGNGSFEDVLFRQNELFNAAADIDGNGRIDNLDLFALEDAVAAAGNQAVTAYDTLLLRRGDINGDQRVDRLDAQAVQDRIGEEDWRADLDASGRVTIDDVATLIERIVRSVPGDFDLDADVDGDDFLLWQQGFGTIQGAGYGDGDADLDGDVDGDDFLVWQSALGFVRGSGAATGRGVAVPEVAAGSLFGIAALAGTAAARGPRQRTRHAARSPCLFRLRRVRVGSQRRGNPARTARIQRRPIRFR